MDQLMSVEGVGFPKKHPPCSAHLHGWMLETHERVFSALIRRKEPKVVVELGCWYGASSLWFAKHCPNAKLFAVDLWDDSFILDDDHYNKSNEVACLLRNHPLYETYLANLWDYKDIVIPMRMGTTRALELLQKNKIVPDIIYIDADHHYDAVKSDITACLTMFPNAVLVGDDYGNYDDVRRAVHECANDYLKTGTLRNNNTPTPTCIHKISMYILSLTYGY
jgi:hypothetical protein